MRFVTDEESKKQYKKFLEENEKCNFQQSLEWAEVKKPNWIPEVILAEDEEKNIKKENYESGYKTVALRFINAFQLICCIIIAFVNWSNEKIITGFTFLFSGIVLFAFIKGFSDIIDLLDSINGKLDNK